MYDWAYTVCGVVCNTVHEDEPIERSVINSGLGKMLRGYCTHNKKLACFVLYLKVINTFVKITYASYSKLSKELKNGIEILCYGSKQSKCCLDQ